MRSKVASWKPRQIELRGAINEGKQCQKCSPGGLRAAKSIKIVDKYIKRLVRGNHENLVLCGCENRTKQGQKLSPGGSRAANSVKNDIKNIKIRKIWVYFPVTRRFYRFLSDLGVHFGGHFRGKIQSKIVCFFDVVLEPPFHRFFVDLGCIFGAFWRSKFALGAFSKRSSRISKNLSKRGRVSSK